MWGALCQSRSSGTILSFLAYLLLERGDFLPAPFLIPLKCRQFLTSTRQLLQKLRADLDWNAFRVNVELLPTEVDTDASLDVGFRDYLSHTTARELWSHICTGADHSQDNGLGHEHPIRLHQAGEQSSERAIRGCKLPLLKGQATETYDLPFWLELYARLLDVKKGTWPVLFAFWNRAPSKVEPCALLSFGRPSPHLTRFIVSPDVHDEAWCDWLPQPASSKGGLASSSCNSSMQAEHDRNLTLRQYLDSCCNA